MAKLSQQTLERIKKEAERIPYGKLTIILNETQRDVHIIVEEQLRYPKEEDKPVAGQVVTKGEFKCG